LRASRRAPWYAAAAVAALALLAGCTSAGEEQEPVTSDAPEAESTPTPTASPEPEEPKVASSSAIFKGGPFLDPRSEAMMKEQELRVAGKIESADKIAQISRQPTAIWLGEWIPEAQLPAVLGEYRAEAAAAGTTLVFVIYAIPNRDCGGLSAGGLDAGQYLAWVQTIANLLNGSGAALIVEPDSIAMLMSEKCAGEAERRLPMLKSAVEIFGAAGLTTYLDAGNNNWVPEEKMAEMLTAAGVAEARGFFTNVSNFYRVDEEREYGEALSALLGGKRFVIDVSRNGNGWQGDWCNPTGAALGQTPRIATKSGHHLDALLWIKHPGQSDGACNGGPRAGLWWPEYAYDLVDNAAANG
jgi:endoglucanase